jgi:hypothetical protein
MTAPAKPRLLLSFPFEEEQGAWHIPMGDACARALEEMGFEVLRFNPVQKKKTFPGSKTLERLFVLGSRLALVPKQKAKQMLPWNEERMRWQRLLHAAESFRPQVLLVIATFTYPEEILKRLREEFGVRHFIGWCVEGPSWIRSPLEESRLYDSYFCIHRYQIPPDAGIEYLPAIAYDPENYYPITPRPPKRHDVTFVGREKRRRVEVMKHILDFNPSIVGPGWDALPAFQPHVKATMIVGEPLNRLYNETKIVLNISAWENQGQDCPNLRIADVPATGSLLLSDYSDYAAELFQPGKEMEFYNSIDELRDKLKYYLAHDEARERIARAGYEKACTLATYRDKVKLILDKSGVPIPRGTTTQARSPVTSTSS